MTMLIQEKGLLRVCMPGCLRSRGESSSFVRGTGVEVAPNSEPSSSLRGDLPPALALPFFHAPLIKSFSGCWALRGRILQCQCVVAVDLRRECEPGYLPRPACALCPCSSSLVDGAQCLCKVGAAPADPGPPARSKVIQRALRRPLAGPPRQRAAAGGV
jgi:hypothetical protein